MCRKNREGEREREGERGQLENSALGKTLGVLCTVNDSGVGVCAFCPDWSELGAVSQDGGPGTGSLLLHRRIRLPDQRRSLSRRHTKKVSIKPGRLL